MRPWDNSVVDRRSSDPRKDHLSASDLQGFLDKRDPTARLRVVRHLLSGCPSCAQNLRDLGGDSRLHSLPSRIALPGSKESDAVGEYDAVLDRAEEEFELFLSAGRPVKEPPGSLLAELTPQLDGVPRRPGPSSRGLVLLVKWLVARSYAMRFDDTEEMLQWALMARLAAESCTTTEAGSAARLADLRALAAAHLGNALRAKGLLRASEDALTVAHRLSQAGTGDLSLHSLILSRNAALCVAQKNFSGAIELARQAGSLSSAIGECDRQAEDLVEEGIAWNRSGDAEKAASLLEQALSRPKFRCNDQWLFVAQNNLALCYIQAGQVSKAIALDNPDRAKSASSLSPLLFLGSLWQRGELLARMGRLDEAEATLRRAHRGFLERALPIQVATMCRRLVSLNREMGRDDRAERILAVSEAVLRRCAEPDTIASVQRLRNAL